MDFGKMLEWLSKLPFLPFATTLITGALLTMGNSIPDWLGLHEHRLWVGILFVAALAFLVSQVFQLVWEWLRERLADRREAMVRHARLHRLTSGEKKTLRSFVQSDRRTVELYPDEHAVVALVSAGILCDTHADSKRLQGYRHSIVIVEWAWQYLCKNRELIADDAKTIAKPGETGKVAIQPTNT